MQTKIHTLNNTKIAEIISNVLVISDPQDALDLLGNLYYDEVDGIVIAERNITPDFFDLKNGMAGEILQKFSNYRMGLAIVGDFTPYTGKSIRDFIYESNKNRQINFVGSTAEALEILSDK